MVSGLGCALVGLGLAVIILASLGLYVAHAVYAPMYQELMSYKPMVEDLGKLLYSEEVDRAVELYSKIGEAIRLAKEARESAASLGEVAKDISAALGALSSTAPAIVELPERLEAVLEGYNYSYGKLVEVKEYLEDIYTETHSKQYNETLDALRELLENKMLLRGLADEVEYAYDYMSELQVLASELHGSMVLAEPLGPEEVSMLMSGAKEGARIAEVLQATDLEAYARQIEDVAELLSSHKLWEAIEGLEGLYNALPPDELRAIVQSARSAYAQVRDALELMEAYPPQRVMLALEAGFIVGLALVCLGAFLFRRALKAR